MKKTFIAVGILCGLMLTLAGCKTKIDTQALNSLTSLSQITPADIKTKTISVADSVEQKHVMGTVKIEVDFPESGNFFVINNIREWMSEQMGGTFEGGMENGPKMLEHYKNAALKDFRENILPDAPPIKGLSCYKDLKINKLYETDRYVTYQYTNEGFSGGAHGWYIAIGQTFRKSDGRRIDYDIFREESKDELAALVMDNIFTQYFESDREQFENGLLIENNDYFPLPQSAPVFREDGTRDYYNEYYRAYKNDYIEQYLRAYREFQDINAAIEHVDKNTPPKK